MFIETIMIENEKFTGAIPTEMGQLESLSALSLGKCNDLKITDE